MTAAVYQPRHRSPTALTMVILLHGGAIAALALARMEMPTKPKTVRTEVELIEVKPDPKPLPPEPIRDAKPLPIDRFTPIVPTPPPPRPQEPTFERVEREAPPKPTFTETRLEPEPEPVARPEPVRRNARIDPRSEMKPPYPASEQRAGNEGTVTVKVLIGADGRVKSAQKVRATNDAFFQATLRHALRNWRFSPATVDGRPIESSMTMTLHFELEGEG